MYGPLNIPNALKRDALPAPAPQPQMHVTAAFEVPAALATPPEDDMETPQERVARLSQLVKAYTLAQAHGLPSFAAGLAEDAAFQASGSFWEFSERIVTAAMRRVYRPDGLEALLVQLGERSVGPKVLDKVRAALDRYAPIEGKPLTDTPLLKRIRCVPPVCLKAARDVMLHACVCHRNETVFTCLFRSDLVHCSTGSCQAHEMPSECHVSAA